MRTPRFIPAVTAAILAFAVPSCAETDPSGEELVDEGDGKQDGNGSLIGSWNVEEFSSDPSSTWVALVLKTDKTFYMWPESHEGVEGTYKVKRTTSVPAKRYLILTTETEEHRRQFRSEDGSLFLRPAGGSWQEMVRTERAACVVKEDCSLQNLTRPSCSGSWSCEDDGSCKHQCD